MSDYDDSDSPTARVIRTVKLDAVQNVVDYIRSLDPIEVVLAGQFALDDIAERIEINFGLKVVEDEPSGVQTEGGPHEDG